ncbi:MAG: PDZ domain-containing protein, partial [Lentisphaeria bacterium]|nr:PDZ domain-containing protein [Lentisphaeria bacterium]
HSNDPEQLLADRQDLPVSGFVVADKLVIVPDPLLDMANLQKITVRLNGRSVEASIQAVFPEQGALLLQLNGSLAGLQALEFKPNPGKSRLYAYSRIMEQSQAMVARLEPFSADPAVYQLEGGAVSRNIPGNALILDSAGNAVALLGNNNESNEKVKWSLPWQKWRRIPFVEFNDWRTGLTRRLESAILPATVHFRDWQLSRREKIMGINPVREFYSYVFKLPDGRVIMPLLSTPQQNGRIEKITVQFAGRKVDAAISRVMKDWGVALLDWPEKYPLPAIADAVASMRAEAGTMVWRVNVDIFGDKTDIMVSCDALGIVGRSYCNVWSGSGIKKGVPEMLFTLKGELLGLNLDVRSFNYKRVYPFIDAAALCELLNDKSQMMDIKNMSNPLNSVAFPGIEYQALNSDLARSLGLSRLTRHGQMGLLVSYVYKNSAAERSGLKVGDVLFKIFFAEGGAPLTLSGKNYSVTQEQQFPWQNLDAIPEMYFSEIPEPWMGVKTPLANKLSDIGIGKTIQLAVIRNGAVKRIPFTIENTPVYFEIAPRCRINAMGLSVKNITFEVRRYFRMAENAPGVIISDISAGSPAATAGLRPFEIITSVNDKAVYNIEDFRKALAGVSEVRLAVRRLARERVVTVKLPAGPRR